MDMERTRSGGGTVRVTLCIGREDTVAQHTHTRIINDTHVREKRVIYFPEDRSISRDRVAQHTHTKTRIMNYIDLFIETEAIEFGR